MAEKLPLWRNARWFQLAFGALVGIVGYQLYLHASGAAPLTRGGQMGRYVLLGAATLVFLIYLQNIYRFGLVPDYSLKCRFCNGPVNRYSEFCEHCGADLIAEEKLLKCAKCGAEVYEGTKHCPECGARIAPKEGKGKRKGKGQGGQGGQGAEAVEAVEGWDTPIDATTGVPPPRSEEDRSR